MSKQDLERIDDLGMAAWDDHKPEAFAELFADVFVLRDTTVPETLRTTRQAVAYAESWFRAFPDMHVRTTNRVVGEDSMAAEIEFIGTNIGPLVIGGMWLPPTGRSVVGRASYFVRVKDGKVTEFSSHPDSTGLLIQLGLMPLG